MNATEVDLLVAATGSTAARTRSPPGGRVCGHARPRRQRNRSSAEAEERRARVSCIGDQCALIANLERGWRLIVIP
jgi:hypothetical protein